MAKKAFTPEQIIFKLREVEVLVGQGETVASACRSIGVTEQTYYRWRKQYGGMNRDQLKRLKELEAENLLRDKQDEIRIAAPHCLARIVPRR